jgi:ribosomal protein S18 acetylase RimI-like enzyme
MSQDDVTIVDLQPIHLAQVESWVSSQSASKALLKLPSIDSLDQPEVSGWTAVRGHEVLAIATIELNKEHVGYLECRVKPSERRHGIASQLIDYVLRQPSTKALIHLHAVVDPSNITAQKTLDTQGFTRTGYAADGRMEFARHKAK